MYVKNFSFFFGALLLSSPAYFQGKRSDSTQRQAHAPSPEASVPPSPAWPLQGPTGDSLGNSTMLRDSDQPLSACWRVREWHPRDASRCLPVRTLAACSTNRAECSWLLRGEGADDVPCPYDGFLRVALGPSAELTTGRMSRARGLGVLSARSRWRPPLARS